jgi:Ca2+-binding EF-hand superfamily protein
MSNRPPPIERKSTAEAIAEAESRPLDFDPHVRARFVRQMLHDVQRLMAQGLSEQEIRQRVPEFAEKYPELFKKILLKQDLTPLQSMFAMLDKMGDGKLTQHQASVIVGKKLVDRYITPQLNGDGSQK